MTAKLSVSAIAVALIAVFGCTTDGASTSELTLVELTSWLDEYGAAWESRDPDN